MSFVALMPETFVSGLCKVILVRNRLSHVPTMHKKDVLPIKVGWRGCVVIDHSWHRGRHDARTSISDHITNGPTIVHVLDVFQLDPHFVLAKNFPIALECNL